MTKRFNNKTRNSVKEYVKPIAKVGQAEAVGLRRHYFSELDMAYCRPGRLRPEEKFTVGVIK
ncbi:hypothetical protein BCON_0153g00190 [Botryotinia convoluta]|uniref:Uncharacterized protein n=1 Tax=Botryotinia convoluta TaxID=54673 RepID=A0A4Z1HXE7_9HELO|nr:hypothetical protein BCON_0153g00190 [Botryotinia convoluta]